MIQQPCNRQQPCNNSCKCFFSEDHHLTQYKELDGFDFEHALVPDEAKLNVYADYPMLLMECFRIMLEKSPKNAEMFRACGGARCIHNIVLFQRSRAEALKIIQELILNGAKDDLGLSFPPFPYQLLAS